MLCLRILNMPEIDTKSKVFQTLLIIRVPELIHTIGWDGLCGLVVRVLDYLICGLVVRFVRF